jgi:ribonuclease HI
MILADTTYDPHISTLNHINKLSDLCDMALESDAVRELGEQEELYPDLIGKTVASCDASIKENPGGIAASGIVIRFADSSSAPWVASRILPTAVTNNQAEYDAVYEALNYFRSFGPGYRTKSIEIRTDSKLVVNQLSGTWKVNEENLKHRHESVTEVLAEVREGLGIPITVVWYPRNSTDDLKQANYIAQDALGVKNH